MTTAYTNFLKKLPRSLHPYVRLGRFDKPIGIWLLVLPAWFGLTLTMDDIGDLFLYFLLFLGAVVMRAAGCIFNDILDRHIDRQVERTKSRPLAAGEISLFRAALFMAGLGFVGLIILLQLNSLAIIVAAAALLPVAAYPMMKRWIKWPQAFLGITFSWGALVGGIAAVSGFPAAVIPLYLGCVAWVTGYDTIYAYQDRADDAKIGINSTALTFGEAPQKPILYLYGAFVALTMAAGALENMNPLFYVGLLYGGYGLYRQVKNWDLSPESSLDSFKNNKKIGFIILGALLVGKFEFLHFQ